MASKGEDQFRVCLYGEPIGWIHRREDYSRFVFDQQYVEDADRSILGLRFEEDLFAKVSSNLRLPSWFSNLLPEGRLRQWIGMARNVSVDREVELLVQVGHDLPGAVTVLPVGGPVPVDEDAGEDAMALPDAPAAPLWRFSLAGVGLKFSMLAKGDRFTAPATGEGGDWIIKLPDPDYAGVPRNEFAMMTLARAVGIEVPEIALVHRDQVVPLPESAWAQGETYAYAIKRFDRGADRELIHIEDFAQVRGFYPDNKYTGSFETIAALVYRRRDVDALREFARRLAFNILIGNGDAHLKNWSLIYRNRRVPTLSPAYDLVATWIYRPPGTGPEDLGLKFGKSRRFETVTAHTFAALDDTLGARADLAAVANDVVQKVLDNWSVAEHVLQEYTDVRRKLWSGIQTRAASFRRM